jgi:hypothetical protein
LAEERGSSTQYVEQLGNRIQRRELLRIAGQLSQELGLGFVETGPGEAIEGRLRQPVMLTSGKFALIERLHEFILVPGAKRSSVGSVGRTLGSCATKGSTGISGASAGG